MAKDFQLIHVTVDKARLKGASNRLRNQFVGCMHAHNELTILNRLLMFTMNDTGNSELHNSAQSAQMWCMLQILAAKLFETWAMLTERFLRSNPPDVVARLEPAQQESLQWLTDYFGNGQPFKGNHPLKTAGLTGYVCTPGASPAGIPSRRCRYSIPSLKATVC